MSTTQPTLQNPDEIKDRLSQLRKEYAAVRLEERSDPTTQRMRAIHNEVEELDCDLTMALAIERREKATAHLAATGPSGGQIENRSLGAMIANSEVIKDWASHGYSDNRNLDFELSGVTLETRAPILTEFDPVNGPGTGFETAALDSSGSGMFLPVGQPQAPTPRQARLFMRDLIPVMRTGLAGIPYVRELNPLATEGGLTGGAQGTLEGAIKPEANILFQGDEARPTTIPVALRIAKQLFDDAAALINYINSRLPYLERLREDQYFLNGNGAWPALKGITQYAGVQTQPAGSAGFVAHEQAITIGNGIALVENVDGTANAVVQNPLDAWAMFTKRAAGGAGTFDAGIPFAAPMMTVWGLASYRSRVYPQGQALVGDFRNGATVVDRETVNVQTYRERFIEQNVVYVLCEARVGLMVERPDLFVESAVSV